ncbi:hypothetical protein [Emticicia aquatilis]
MIKSLFSRNIPNCTFQILQQPQLLLFKSFSVNYVKQR